MLIQILPVGSLTMWTTERATHDTETGRLFIIIMIFIIATLLFCFAFHFFSLNCCLKSLKHAHDTVTLIA